MSWPYRSVSDLCLFAVDCVNKTAPTVEHETPYKMIRTTNVKNGFIFLDEVKYVTKDIFEKWTRRSKPEYGDVILTREAPVGEVGRFTSNDDNIFLGQRLFHYRANPKLLDWNFLAYILQSHSIQGKIRGMGFGATVDHIKVGDAENLLIPTPPIEIQRQIGNILASYDDLIENNRRRIVLLEESARLLYQEWFVRFRFPGHEKVKIVDGVPEGWEKKMAYDVMEILSGGTPKTTTSAFWDGEIPFFTPKDTNSSIYVFSTEKTLTEAGLKKCNSLLYPVDTIFITARGTVGKLCLAQIPMAINQSCYALIAIQPITQYFIFFGLQNKIYELQSKASGSVFDAIIRDTFKQIPFLSPTHDLISRFTETISPILQQTRNLLSQNRKLRQARDLLLPRLMSGEIAV